MKNWGKEGARCSSSFEASTGRVFWPFLRRDLKGLLRSEREVDTDCGAALLGSANGGGAPVKFGDFFDEGEAEAIALSGAFLAVGVESFEGAGCGEVGDAGALVGDREGEIFSTFPEGESHFSTSRRKLNGVFEEVVERGPEEGFVSEKSKIGGELGMQGDFRGLGQR